MQRLDRAGIEVLLGTEQFKSWFAALSGLHHRLELVTASVERLSESFAETVFRRDYRQDIAEEALLGGADLQNACQNLRSEVAGLENEAFRQLAAFGLGLMGIKFVLVSFETITAEVMVTGVADRMSKHRYQLGMVGAERQRGGRALPGPRAEAPKPKAGELDEREQRAHPYQDK